MMRLAGLWRVVVLMLSMILSPMVLAQSVPSSVLFISAQPTQPGKFERLKDIAAQEGVRIEVRFVERFTGQEKAGDFAGFGLIIIDAPYGSGQGVVKERLTPLLPQVTTPWVWMQASGPETKGVDAAAMKTLHTYYSNGGRANFAEFFCQVNALVFKHTTRICAPPQVFPDAGIYHHDYAGRVFPTLEEFMAWKSTLIPTLSREERGLSGRPVVAILFHQAHFASELTGFLDDSIRRIEAAGALALPIYAPAMTDGAITRLVSRDGKPFADVLINTQIMLNAEGRRTEFEALGIPVIQAMPYRRGEQADWEKDTAGVTTMDIPFYLSQPEYAGITDPLIAAYSRKSDGDIVAVDYQLQSVVNKAINLARLRHLPNAEKKTAIFFWNYPPGEKNLGASFLNLPRSMENTLRAMKGAGYTIETPDAPQLTLLLQRLLTPLYRDGELEPLLREGLAELMPVATYRRWFETLPAETREKIIARFGEPEQSSMVVRRQGQAYFAIPRLQLGNTVILPQPPRGEKNDDKEKAIYHSTAAPLNHFYLAAYLWAREAHGSNAIVHYGTHGSQEWTPGKERGLSIYDSPYLLLGDVPVIYPYIVDDIGEALQTKRRGRATVISHATPPFAPAGLHGEINRLHDLLHTWLNMTEGEVRDKTRDAVIRVTLENKIDRDMAWDSGKDGARIRANFKEFADALHIQLHDLALANQPLGLATFGLPAESDLRLFTVMQMLGNPLLAALQPDDPEEMIVGDYQKLRDTPVWKLLDKHVRQGEPYVGEGKPGDAKTGEMLARAREYWLNLTQTLEMKNFIKALEGRYTPTSYGGDPIKNPDALPTGRNLYGFDPSRVPTQVAWEAGREGTEKLIAQYREKHGEYPKKLAFSLWSVETMRHFGVLEAQAFAALGFKPKWDAGGRVIGIEVIPAAELKRPRVDVVLSATGLYRDHFPNVMRWLAQAAAQAAALDEPGNPVAAHSREIEAGLLKRGVEAGLAQRLAGTRIFSNQSGSYGTGLDDATLASDTWGVGKGGKEDRAAGDKKLASLYLSRMQYAYGTDEKEWGSLPSGAAQGVNLYAENLKGVQAALLSRSSNLYGMLTTDDPFQYLGGISLAVRSLTGKSPELYISNLRESGAPRMETAAGFLAKELRTRQFHPGWIAAMKKEGYSGALNMLDAVNNLWGWQAVAPETVRNDQWDELKAVYVDDKYKLGMKNWFEKNHPHAQAQMIERMLEAARKGYWQTDAENLEALAQRYRELARRFDVRTDNRKFTEYAGKLAGMTGYGLSVTPRAAQGAPSPQAKAETAQAVPKPTPVPQPPLPKIVTGQQMVKQTAVQAPSWLASLPGIGLILLAMALGAWRRQRIQFPTKPLSI
ncbi:MAG: cobaltochelatase subunit CobN [Methylotenera sp.]|nr:cobaltochelatase subunit CobN [Methylotenera sp.]